MQLLGGEHSRQGTASAKAPWQAGALCVWVTARRPVWPACREEVRRGRRWGWGAPGGHESCTCPIPPVHPPERSGPLSLGILVTRLHPGHPPSPAPPRPAPGGPAALTHLHVLRREAGEGLQRVVRLVALSPLHVLVVVRGALAPQPQVADELLHLPEGNTASLQLASGKTFLRTRATVTSGLSS